MLLSPRPLDRTGPDSYTPAMFGLSLTKILFTIALIVLVWRGFRLWQRLEARRGALKRDRQVEQATRPGALGRNASGNPKRGTTVEETEACPICDTFQATGSVKPCGRRDCPYPG